MNRMVVIYAMLYVKHRYALLADDNPDNLPLVPSNYVDDVLDYLKAKTQQIEERKNRI